LLPIKLTLAGGLGNQLFQLSAGIYLEEKLGRRVTYDFSNLRARPQAAIGNYTRKFEIEELIAENKLIRSKYSFQADYPIRYFRRLINPDSVISEDGPNFDALKLVDTKTTAVYGYFQSASTVNSSWPTLKLRLQQSTKFNSLVNSQKINRIAIHLRFGDYSDDPRTKSVHGLTASDYFENATNILKTMHGVHIPTVVVTDDREKATEFISNSSTSSDFQFISNSSPLEDLIEIARSAHVVATNSTFSWWGGWIASMVHNSNVIYPRPWFADIADPELPIYVGSWTGIKRGFHVV
jgi:hypothetical protein